MDENSHEIALANGQVIDVTGRVELLESGVMHVRPEGGSAYYLSPAGWWSWAPAVQDANESEVSSGMPGEG